jgi:hypothetical protein
MTTFVRFIDRCARPTAAVLPKTDSAERPTLGKVDL